MSEGRFLIDLALVLAAAVVGGWGARRIGLSPVLGEVAAGVALAPGALGRHVGLAGPSAALEALATLGGIVLLFEVGLETPLRSLRAVGASSLAVAALGVVVAWLAGSAASLVLAAAWPAWTTWPPAVVAPGSAVAAVSPPPWLLHLFVGAALTATSVGITARVLRDQQRSRSPEARIILGAAVADDVLGLLALGVMGALAANVGAGAGPAAQPLDGLGLVRLVAVPLAFLAVAALLAWRILPRAADWLARRGSPAILVPAAILLAVAAAAGAVAAGLAAIVGAFLAGLAIAPSRAAAEVARGVRPVGAVLVPVFFVVMGLRVDLGALQGHAGLVADAALVLLAAAVAGKLAAGLGVVRRQADRLVVGVGMVPRGEVGFVFAAVGLAAGILAPWHYAVLVLVAAGTTFITPPWLRRLDGRFGPEMAP